jgi:MoaA/NifB/PqqE/SkfB family radical SAM enzyme
LVVLGFALTEHCNLRCPHCIRDDVTTVRSLDANLVFRVVDEAREALGTLAVSLTGGEPLLHPDFEALIEGLHSRGIPWRMVSNGWHMRRIMPLIDRCPPQYIRLSLSGATRTTHDHDRGRGSYNRVLTGLALLTSRRVPTALSMVIDRRNRHELTAVVELAESLGCTRLHIILPQPVPGSVARDSDLPPQEWLPVRREVDSLAAAPGRRTVVQLDYGAPFDGPESPCDTFLGRRIYIDARGQLSTCCQLSEYGFAPTDVVADLAQVSFQDALPVYRQRLEELREAQTPRPGEDDPLSPFPCLRCARACGKLAWLGAHPGTPWQIAAGIQPLADAVVLPA